MPVPMEVLWPFAAQGRLRFLASVFSIAGTQSDTFIETAAEGISRRFRIFKRKPVRVRAPPVHK